MPRVFKKSIVRYLDTDGRQVPKDAPGARKIKEKSSKWYGRVPGAARPIPLCHNKGAAEIMLNEKVRKAEQVKAGIVDPFEDHHQRPLKEHLEDYRRYLLGKGNCAEHVAKTIARCRAVFEGCRFIFIGDLSAPAVVEFLHALRRDPPRPALPPGQEWFAKAELLAALGEGRPGALARILRREGLAAKGNGKARRYPRQTVEALQDRFCRGLGVSTSNGYTLAVKGFTKWLVKNERTGADRLVSLSCLNADVDVRHERRAASEDELRLLLSVALSSPEKVEGLFGPERAWLYAVAMATGFRASELASLTPESFHLEGPLPAAVVRAAYTKNRRKAEQPLPPDLADALRGFLSARPARFPVWPGDWPEQGAEMLRHDLALAGIPYRDAEGRVFDFHALRHSYITLLNKSGVSPRMAQELARHSDINLTMKTYTHLSPYDRGAAVAGLPVLLPTVPESETKRLRATGTDAQDVPFSCPAVAHTRATERDSLITPENPLMGEPDKERKAKTLVLQGVESGCERLRRVESELPGQDSNLDKESQNPLVAYSVFRGKHRDYIINYYPMPSCGDS